jgi:DNA-binding NarL/FixJ family response regulator
LSNAFTRDHLARHDAGAGLIEIGRLNPAVIVLDYSLPDLNADEVVERLSGRHLDSEVLVVTGGVEESALERLQRLGVKEIVEKRSGIDAVVAAIGKALARQREA